MKRLNVILDKPQAGWLPIKISGEGGSVKIVASYTPKDSFSQLVSSVKHTYETGLATDVSFNDEPDTVRLRFTKFGDILVIDQFRGDQHLVEVRGSFQTACREFARRFVLLLDEIGYSGFTTEWGHKPPRKEIREFWSYFSR